jgi:hypothetical protein
MTNNYHKIGRLRLPVAKSIHRPAADIYIDGSHLKHIANRHGAELAALGFDAFTFVTLAVGNYNRIYKGSGDSLLLVIYNGKPKVAAIELNFSLREKFYEVKTAVIVRKGFLKEEQCIWKAEKK